MLRSLTFPQGHTIIKEGEPGKAAFIIAEGSVRVEKELNGEPVVLAELGVGATFGEMSLFDQKPRSATVVAVEQTTVWEVDRDQFIDTIRNDPESAMMLLRGTFERIRSADDVILALNERLAAKEA